MSNGPPKTMEYRNFSEVDIESFRSDIKESPLGTGKFDCSLDEAVSLYNQVLTGLMDKHCPVKKKTLNKRYAPWIDEELRDLRRKRRRAESAWRKGTGPKAEYKQLSRQFIALDYVELQDIYNKQ